MTPKITHVIRFVNGMVLVFDQRGEQMPAYQGRWDAQRARILRDKPDAVRIEGPAEWFDGQREVLGTKRHDS